MQALGWSFAFRGDDPALGRHLERLYTPFPTAASAGTTYSFVDLGPEAEQRYVAYADDVRLVRAVDPTLVLGRVLWHLNRSVVDGSPDLLLLHAAAAERGGEAIVLPAPMEFGKTTTVAGLFRRGLRYVTDEIVAIDPGTLAITAYPKPLSVDEGSWEVLADLRPPRDEAVVRYEGRQWQVQPAALRADAVAATAHPRALVLPRYVAGATSRLDPLPRAAALHRTIGEVFRPGALERWRFRTLADLVRSCGCWELTVGDLDEACGLVLDLFDG